MAAVTASELKAAERRATEAEAREQAALTRAADAEQQARQVAQELTNARVQVQAQQAGLDAAAREVEQARKVAQEARADAKTAGEQAAELRGKLSAVQIQERAE